MAKRAGLFRILAGIGAASAAVVLSRKESRDKLKEQYNKYKQDPEGYKENAKDLANQIGAKANEKIQDVRNNPQDYANRLKNDPKGFLEEEKSKFTSQNSNKEDSLQEGKFDDEGGATVNNNLRVVSEEDLKDNKNALEDKD
ncbi:putative staphylococcal protein [Staphylococcus petrasii]|uniref:Putative staphylococcal protein n=1 Tax=Staphylococcus petrasii TaxID=1276936 RepID=A0A380G116_9STAP|nr:YtxH domain-containing protein [Staphylococcus petrasii]PNZ28150.1 YtxH domain-containing protein [Staphylococcus petrasii]TGE12734.1 YtxH domain-containing protein [Staphylococcus petrasii]TGE16922.1 YtxH domain-containing protein [Staphylococcus petrasii]SUM43938.1 putative staphylococcal protein [Staphylococcus petrasii]